MSSTRWPWLVVSASPCLPHAGSTAVLRGAEPVFALTFAGAVAGAVGSPSTVPPTGVPLGCGSVDVVAPREGRRREGAFARGGGVVPVVLVPASRVSEEALCCESFVSASLPCCPTAGYGRPPDRVNRRHRSPGRRAAMMSA